MTASSDDDLQALESARSRLAARLQGTGSLLPVVQRHADPRAAAMAAMLRTAVEKIDEALALLRNAPSDPVRQQTADTDADTFRTVLRAKSTSSLSSLIPTLQPVEARDDLTQVQGISEAIARHLAAIGVTRLRQIADWDAGDVRHIGHALGLDGAIGQQNWIVQARTLAASSPVTVRLKPVLSPVFSSASERSSGDTGQADGTDMTVAGIGLGDILASIRSATAPRPAHVQPAPADKAPRAAQWAADPGESVYGSVRPLPVAPDAPPPKAAPGDTAPVPVHEDAATRLAQLETELQALAKNHPSATAAKAPDDTIVLAPPTLRDRLGGLPPAMAVQDLAIEVEEAEVMIVTAAPSRRKTDNASQQPPARIAPPPAQPPLALVPVQATRPPVQSPPPSEPPGGSIDVDEATVVIVRQPKAAQLMPGLPFFQAAVQPLEERAVQRFLKALHGE